VQGRLDCVYQTGVELSALALQCEWCPIDLRAKRCTEFPHALLWFCVSRRSWCSLL
jgi:hypothetical protein